MKRLALLLLSLLVHAAAAQAPRDFAYGIALSTEGDSAFYQVELPPAVYAGVVRGDLGDLRVFNADGARRSVRDGSAIRTRLAKRAPRSTCRFFHCASSSRRPT